MPHVITTNNEGNSESSEFKAAHIPQLSSSGVPEHFWSTLHRKLRDEIFDAGEDFQLIRVEHEDDKGEKLFKWKVIIIKDDGMLHTDPEHIYLIDHAWTYGAQDARAQLHAVPALVDRMAGLMDLTSDEKSKEEVIEDILDEMWRFNQTYKFGHFSWGSDESMPLWYVMDEFGSRIQHSDEPSFKTVPFFYAPSQISFTLMWPVRNMSNGEEVTRNYVENVTDVDKRCSRLLPWIYTDMKHLSHEQTEPGQDYFMSYRANETLPNESMEVFALPRDRSIKVFMNYSPFEQHLTDSRFELVDSEDDADIIWTKTSWKDYKKLSEEMPGKYVNQFPYEMVVTIKDMLAIISRRAADATGNSLDCGPRWLPVTYNLQTELPKFVSYFQHREEQGLDNHWICKPWNLARSLDTHITNNLNHIVRLPETGPKVACKYVEDPVLFSRELIGDVKFDIRYIVLLSSVEPLKLYVYRIFWLRFANKPYSLDHLDDYEKHFTVMNYAEGVQLKQVHYDEFIPQFESQYPNFQWTDIETDIFQIFRELFEAAVSKPYPRGICPSPQSRAMYAVDLLLKWTTHKDERKIQPVICEVNFCPDCDRACKYHPRFVNDLMCTLFLDETEDRPVTQLC